MNEKDYRERIGEKMKEAYLSQPMGEAPSKETIQKWIEIAEQKRAERIRRRKKMAGCAAALAVCVFLGVACICDPPEVSAGGKGGSTVEQTLETSDVYNSYEELPDEVKAEFLMFTEMPDGYDIKEIRVENTENIQKLFLKSTNVQNEEFLIEEIVGENNQLLNAMDSSTVMTSWDGRDVYIRQYTDGNQMTTYKFMYNEVFVKISTVNDFKQDDVKDFIKKAAI